MDVSCDRADPELPNSYSMSPFALAAHGSDVEQLLAKASGLVVWIAVIRDFHYRKVLGLPSKGSVIGGYIFSGPHKGCRKVQGVPLKGSFLGGI